MEIELAIPKKLEFLLSTPARFKILYGGRGGAKCLALGTKVIMADGSLRAIENIWTGESVMGPDSKPRKVLGTTRGRSMMYKIHQTSGIDYIVNSAHILSLKKSKSSMNEKGEISKADNARRPNGRYSSYPEIYNINVIEANQKSNRWKEHFRGYKAGLIKFDKKEILIDPWYLGAWLGDGRSDGTTICTGDGEILEACYKYADELGMGNSIYKEKSNCVSVAITKIVGRDGRTNLLWEKFKHYNLFDNKHIPFEYLTNSEEIRLQVLAGLIDTDGTVHSNGYNINQVNEQLAKDIKYLADTLGFRTNFSKRKTVCGNNGAIGEAFRVSINGDTWRIPCKVKRKQILKENIHKNKDFLLSQIKIECVGEGEYAGFVLDGDHLFLLEDGTVTHNTESVARVLLALATQRRLRIACFRELQNSLDESVYATFVNCIYDLWADGSWVFEWDIQKTTIISKRTGSEFIFSGLRYKIEAIKSMARIDIAWLEEARNSSKTTLDKLFPTIRGVYKKGEHGGPFGKGPEIWITFNPELDTDEIYKRCVKQRDKYFPEFIKNEETGEMERYAIVTKVNHSDNPFLPEDLRQQMAVAKQASLLDPDDTEYLEVWEGHTKQVLAGAVYAKEIKKILKEERRGRVLYNSNKPVYTFWDLGHSDKTAIWFVQHAGVEFNLIHYYENRLEKMPHYIEYLQELKYNYAAHILPHDGDAETLSNVTPKTQLRNAFPNANIRIVNRPSKKAVGINAVRTILDLCNFDETNTSEGWMCLCNYAFKINDDNGVFSKEPEHDTPWSHGCDALQTMALSLKPEKEIKVRTVGSNVRTVHNIGSRNGWMGT